MPKHISNPPQRSLFGQEQAKDTKLSEFLRAVPFLSFSEKGLSNIAKRFNVTVEELKQRIAEFDAREGLQDGGH